ncbi:CAP domain-containing protein [Actibacterium ureilyticum]|uniref:CAP domain-containing protein n=1 Tax=Actibacterium ureilyticum TaxID=1590614 RepID=UPI0015959945|nr:CAP domain-containing protein [Actibacterium ureilyticum]
MRPRPDLRLLPVLLCLTAEPVMADTGPACMRRVPDGAAQATVPARDIDQSLIDATVRAEVNYQRCLNGISPLDPAEGLRRAALGHSRWMADSAKLSHRSTRPGRSTIWQRVRSAGLAFRAAAENIAVVHRYRVDGRKIRVLDRAECKFAAGAGDIVAPHSYDSLARQAVRLWMRSPSHRRNILNKHAGLTGTAVGFSGDPRFCGKFWLTQNFLELRG